MSVRIINADVLDGLRSLPDESVQCVVTSPPYWGLRDYGCEGQIGLEATPQAFIARLVDVFREVRRVLRKDGTCWVNLGDSYAAADRNLGRNDAGRNFTGGGGNKAGSGNPGKQGAIRVGMGGLKPKDLVGIPWRFAFAAQEDGWWLRQDIIWSKPNPMPESVQDRCTKAHEYVFLLTKAERYFYDAEAIAEAALQPVGAAAFVAQHKQAGLCRHLASSTLGTNQGAATRNKRSVWSISTQPFEEAHFATMPPELAETCIKAGSKPGDTVLDPFSGAGTTALVADRLQRNAIGIELNPEYAEMSRRRLSRDAGMFASVALEATA